MSISMVCPCGRNIRVKQELVGKRVKCPSCKQLLAVPAGDPEAAAAASFDEMIQAARQETRPSGEKLSRNQARSGAYALLAAAILQTLVSLFWALPFLLDRPENSSLKPLLTGLAIGEFVATILLYCLFIWALDNPLPPTIIGLVVHIVFMGAELLVVISIWMLVIKTLIAIALIDGVLGGLYNRRLRQKKNTESEA